MHSCIVAEETSLHILRDCKSVKEAWRNMRGPALKPNFIWRVCRNNIPLKMKFFIWRVCRKNISVRKLLRGKECKLRSSVICAMLTLNMSIISFCNFSLLVDAGFIQEGSMTFQRWSMCRPRRWIYNASKE